ncbi:MAG: hypothetical protein LUD77_00070 [Clostridiales bacterium]|nr:hypothetical protein [Clostridiales bacterium]
MDFLEREQFEDVLDYIRDYPLKYSDKEIEKLLNDFRASGKKVSTAQGRLVHTLYNYTIDSRWNCEITDKIITSKFNFELTYKEGSSKEQLMLFKAILLSAKYNLNRLENELFSEREKIKKDILNDTYGWKTIEDPERLRLKAADCIKKADKFWGKVTYIAGFGRYIYGGLEKLAEYRLIKEAAVKSMISDTARRMINDGASLTRIVSCLEAEPLEIYNIAESMNRPFTLSSEEEELLRKAQKEAESKKEKQKDGLCQTDEETDEVRERISNYARYSQI